MELCGEGDERLALGLWDVVGPVVLEEVPAVLAINREHRHEVCRVDSVTKEFEPETGFEVFDVFAVWSCCGVADQAIVGSLEYAGEWRVNSLESDL